MNCSPSALTAKSNARMIRIRVSRGALYQRFNFSGAFIP